MVRAALPDCSSRTASSSSAPTSRRAAPTKLLKGCVVVLAEVVGHQFGEQTGLHKGVAHVNIVRLKRVKIGLQRDRPKPRKHIAAVRLKDVAVAPVVHARVGGEGVDLQRGQELGQIHPLDRPAQLPVAATPSTA